MRHVLEAQKSAPWLPLDDLSLHDAAQAGMKQSVLRLLDSHQCLPQTA